MDWIDRNFPLGFGGFMGAVTVGLIVIMCVVLANEERRWQEFKAAHECKVVGRMSGDVTTTVAPIIGGNGGVAFGVSVSPDKTGWQCNDGITYWR